MRTFFNFLSWALLVAAGIAIGHFFPEATNEEQAAVLAKAERRTEFYRAYEQGRKDEAFATFQGTPSYTFKTEGGVVTVWKLETGWREGQALRK